MIRFSELREHPRRVVPLHKFACALFLESPEHDVTVVRYMGAALRRSFLWPSEILRQGLRSTEESAR